MNKIEYIEYISLTFTFFGIASTVSVPAKPERGITDSELLELEFLIEEGEID